MAQSQRPPDAIFAGYPKSASTYLHDFLDAHPDVFVDKRGKRFVHRSEDPDFSSEEAAALAEARLYVSHSEKLADSRVMRDGVDWTDVRFTLDPSAKLDDFLEHSPEHFAQTLKRRFPETKIVICIRDQIDWLLSIYRWHIQDLDPKHRSFNAYCRTPMGQLNLRAAHYDLTIKAYLDAFGPRQLCVLRFEALKKDRQAALENLCRFLGLEMVAFDAPAANVGRDHATTLVHQKAPWLGALPAPLRRLGRPALRAVSGLLAKKDILPAAERDLLRSAYGFSNLRTRQLIAEIEAAQASEAEPLEVVTAPG